MKQKTSPVLSFIILLGVVIIFGVIISKNKQVAYHNNMNEQKIMTITSNVFANNGNIPLQYTCNGGGAVIPLQVWNVPSDAISLALIVDDPDAPKGEFVHWVLWNIEPKTPTIYSNNLPSGAMQGITGVGKPGWVPPCPPTGTHHYFFKLYALDTSLSLPPTSNKMDLVNAMSGHIIDNATLTGLYGKGN